MAVYFFRMKIFSRSRGSRATKAAAYRAGERIHDERSGDGYNYSYREDVVAKDIVLPSQMAGRTDMNWARDRLVLWNAVEHGDRRNARLAREVLVRLPPDLSAAGRSTLVRRFSQELADKYQNAVDFAVHLPRTGSDERHHHAHILMTARQVTANGLGARTTLELGGRERHARGLRPSKEDLLFLRERWAQVTNEALRDAGLASRIDHRSYKDQGIDREPKPMMPESIRYQEKLSGVSNPAGDDIRARHRERIEARQKGSDALAQVMERQNAEARQRAIEKAGRNASLPKKIPRGALTREELNEKRREYVTANREVIYRNNRKWREANAVEVKRRAREKRQLNAAELNRKQRERRQANAVEFNRRQRERRHARAADAAATVHEKPLKSARAHSLPQNARDTLASNSRLPAATAAESVKKWLAYRKKQEQHPEPKDSLKEWRAYREVQEASKFVGNDTRESDRDADKKRDRGHDAGL